VLLATIALATGLALTVHPFLAVSRPVAANTLVVEGWVAPFATRAAVEEYRRGSYSQVLTTGGPLSGDGGYTNEFNTIASICAFRLRDLGIPEGAIHAAPSRVIARDRTYASAVALRNWIEEHGLAIDRFNVLTESTHGRRTLMLYREAFGPRSEIGVISVANPDYDASRWWETSQGVKDVLSEGFAYVYARLFFSPE
jgi:hypothetical protein